MNHRERVFWRRNMVALFIQMASLAILFLWPTNVFAILCSLLIMVYAILHAFTQESWEVDILLNILFNRWNLTALDYIARWTLDNHDTIKAASGAPTSIQKEGDKHHQLIVER